MLYCMNDRQKLAARGTVRVLLSTSSLYSVYQLVVKVRHMTYLGVWDSVYGGGSCYYNIVDSDKEEFEIVTPQAHARSGVKQSVLVSVVCPAKKIEIYSHKLS